MLPKLWARASSPQGQTLSLRMVGDDHLSGMEVSRAPTSYGDAFECWVLLVAQVRGCARWMATLSTVMQHEGCAFQAITESATGDTAEEAMVAVLSKHAEGATVASLLGITLPEGG